MAARKDASSSSVRDLTERFDNAGNLCKVLDVHLVDWIACDDQRFRSSRLCLRPGEEWWSLA